MQALDSNIDHHAFSDGQHPRNDSHRPPDLVWVQPSAQAEFAMRQELQGGVNFISAAHRMRARSGHKRPVASKSILLTQRDSRLG